MEPPLYNGTWITCGSYAFLHAAGLDKKLLLSVENSAGVSFGMASMQEAWDYTQLLTPAFDFHAGIDAAAPLWGVALEHNVCDGFAEFIAAYGAEPGDYLVGPVNMTGLRYLPLAGQYHYADHYVVLRRESGWTLVDSEGVLGLPILTDELNDILTGRGIPESGGKLHIRRVRRMGEMASFPERAVFTIEKGASNLKRAKQRGQGPQAFLKCATAIAQSAPVLWREGLSYDLDYTTQRRLMILRFLGSISGNPRFEVDPRLPELIGRQIQAVLRAKAMLRREDYALLSDCLYRLGELEETLTQQWEVWVSYDRD